MKHILFLTVTMLLMTATAIGQTLTRSGLDPARFDSIIDGSATRLIVLETDNGTEACVTNYGARLVSLMEPDAHGHLADVVLGYDNLHSYVTRGQNFGATVGRYIGRIKGPQFTLDGQTYRLQDDGKGHISHGGKPGFANRVWDVVSVSRNSVTMRYVSPDGENGFPGELTVTLTYTLSADALDIDFNAMTTKPTVLNLSNHSFFNLSGDARTDILNEELWVDSRRIACYDGKKNVDGTFRKVARTAFDFRRPRMIGERIGWDDSQLKITGGYDHCFALRQAGDLSKPAAILYDPRSGRRLTVYTTEPALQVYTGNGLKGTETGKGGIVYQRRTAICLETMHFADSPNHPEFPSTVLRPGEEFHSHTIFSFWR